jgi:hypothetical protein
MGTRPVLGDSITIGELVYRGTSEPPGAMTHVELYLNTQGITFDPYVPNLPYPLTFNGVLAIQGENPGDWVTVYTGSFTTIPSNVGLVPPNSAFICPCTGIRLTLTLQSYLPTTFLLADGHTFTMKPGVVVTLVPPSGKTFLQFGQTAPIVVTSVVPESATLFLVGSGLLSIAVVARWKAIRSKSGMR